jgi:uncharacterized protein (TIGR02391 family)
MNLQTHIRHELWTAVRTSYEAGNYSHAVVDAIQFVSQLIRDKSGVDGDGAALVGNALEGESPLLCLNSLATVSEKDEQRGVAHILRGLYVGIRNPRSHERSSDTAAAADAIIYFIDYLVGLLGASSDTFTVERFLSQLRDPDFVTTERYATLLVGKVPATRRGDAIGAIVSNRTDLDLGKLRHVITNLVGRLSEGQLAAFLSAMSRELDMATEFTPIKSALQLVPPEHWPRLDDLVRLRLEEKLLKGIRAGTYVKDKTTEPLATWSRRFVRHFDVRIEVGHVLMQKLKSDDGHRHFVSEYFFEQLPLCVEGDYRVASCVDAISTALRNGDPVVRARFVAHIGSFPATWTGKFVEALKDVTDPTKPGVKLPDGTPLLTAPDEVNFDDIPF